MSNIISASFNDAITVNFTNNAWFNATEVAAFFGKKPIEWLRLETTAEYINCLVEIQRWDFPTFEQNQLLNVKKGSPENGGGTWMHPKLAIPFARWLDTKFAVWCDYQIEKILHPLQYGLKASAFITDGEAKQLSKAITAGHSKQEIIRLYRKLHDAYRITSYKHVPAGKLNEALTFLSLREPAKNEMVLIAESELEALRALPKPKARFQIIPQQDSGLLKFIAEDYDKTQFAMIPIEKWENLLQVGSFATDEKLVQVKSGQVIKMEDFIEQIFGDPKHPYVIVKRDMITAVRTMFNALF